MSVTELAAAHQRYVELSGRFRASWAFQQFVQSIRKIFFEEEKVQQGRGFQDVYSQLKDLSANLNTAGSEQIQKRMADIEDQLGQLTAYLLEEDSRISPNLVRQFFQRVKNYDERILTQLVRFYLYACGDKLWSPDRFDKVDFLLSRLGEDEPGPSGRRSLKEASRLREIFQAQWALLRVPAPNPDEVEQQRQAIESLRLGLREVSSLDELHERQLVNEYRERKRALGMLVFHPELQLAILATNLAFKETIQRLYGEEEQRIISEYQRIFDLERERAEPVGRALEAELKEFKREVEVFERRLSRSEVRLEDLAQLRDRMRELMPRLTEVEPEPAPLSDGSWMAELELDQVLERPGTLAIPPALRDAYQEIKQALEETSEAASVESVTLSPEIYRFRLETREVIAFRREGQETDSDLELMVRLGASARVRLCQDAEDIRTLMDETSVTGDSPTFARARETLRLTGAYVSQYEHHIYHLIDQAGDLAEVRQLELLRMRAQRDYADLWLLTYKPFLPSPSE